jgi:hypothetical protein
MGKIWQYVDFESCCLMFYMLAVSYSCFFILWRITVLCLVIPAICEGIVVLFATDGGPWTKALPRVLFVMLPYVPMVVLFAKRWGHFSF